MNPVRLVLHLTLVEQRLFWRNRSLVFFGFLFPLLLLAVFGSFQRTGSFTAQGLEWREFLLPGIAALAVVSVTFQPLATALVFHREQGVLKRLLASPMPVWGLVAGKLASAAIVVVAEIVVIAAIARLAYGLPLPVQPGLFLLAVALGAVSFAALGVALATLIRSGDSAPALTNAVFLPMMLFSGVFYEVERLPSWLEALGRALPLHHLVELVRGSWIGVPTAGGWGVHLGILAAWGAASWAVAGMKFRWQPRFQG